MGELDIGPRAATFPPKEEILGVMVQYTEVVLKRSTTHNCSMLDKVLITLESVDLGIGPALLPPIIQVVMVTQK